MNQLTPTRPRQARGNVIDPATVEVVRDDDRFFTCLVPSSRPNRHPHRVTFFKAEGVTECDGHCEGWRRHGRCYHAAFVAGFAVAIHG